MAIEPKDIQEKNFSTKMRGYNPVEVDSFLDDIAFEHRRMQDEIDSLNRQLKDAKGQIEYFDEMKDSLNKSIMVAQEAADNVKISSKREAEFTTKEAQKEASTVVDEAHKQAEEYIGEAAGRAQKMVVATEDLKNQARSFRQKLEVMVEAQLQMIKGKDWENLLNSDELLTIGEIKDAMKRNGYLDNPKLESVNSEELKDVPADTPALPVESESIASNDSIDNEDSSTNDASNGPKTVVVFPEEQTKKTGLETDQGFHISSEDDKK